MKIRVLPSIFSFIVLLASGNIYAQNNLTLKEAIQFALQNKADALKAQLDVKNSGYQVTESMSNLLPQINAQGGLTYNVKLQQMALDLDGQTTVIKMGTPWQTSPTIQLDQTIFNLSMFQGLKAARTTKEFYQLNANLTEEQIIEKVANSYYEVFKTKAEINTLNQTIQNTTRMRDIIANLEQNGLAKRIDLDRMNVTLSNTQSSLTKMQNTLVQEENGLKYLIGMSIDQEVNLEPEDFEIKAKEKADLTGLNPENRTELQILEKKDDLLNIQKKSINAGRYPTASISANYGYMAMGSKIPYFNKNGDGLSGSDFSAVTLNIKIPIFNGFLKRSQMQQAQIDIDKNKLDLADMRLSVSLDIQNAASQMNNALVSLKNQNENKVLAKNVLDNIENNYKNGLATLNDLLDAENSYADAQNNYTDALLDYKLAEVQLKKAGGTLKAYYLGQ